MPGNKGYMFISSAIVIVSLLIAVLGAPSIFSRQTETEPEQPDREEPTPPEVAVTTRTLRPETQWETELYIMTAAEDGPTVMILGGVHGDEIAGYLAADLVATWAIDRGTLLVLPRANVPAIETTTRFLPGHFDLNANFPGSSGGNPTERLARSIYEVMDEFRPDWVIDLHEAWEFERVQYRTLGQTIIYPPEGPSLTIVEQIAEGLNCSISEELHMFQVLRGGVKGGTTRAAQSLGLESFLIETTRKLPLEERINQHLNAVRLLLSILNMNIYDGSPI